MFLGLGYSRANYVQGLIVQKPSPPVARTTTTTKKSLRQSSTRDPIGGTRNPKTTRDQTHISKNGTIRRTDETSSQGTTTNFAGSIVSTVGSDYPTTKATTTATTESTTPSPTTTASESFDTESENPTTSPPPPMEQVRIHHDYDNDHDDQDGTIDDKQEESASAILRRKKLKRILKERRRSLMDERRRVKEKIRSIDQAIQNLRIAGEGKGDDTITLGSRASTVITVKSTPYSTPVTNVEARVRTANSVKSDKDITTQDVRNIEWTVAAPDRRSGQYSGTALNGKIPHGTGVLVFANEEVYEGPFKYGVMQGSNGLLMSASGATYEGGFWLNLRHGHGEEVFACGSRYVGKYEKGLPHGFGERRNPDGTVFYVGQWAHGKPAGLEDVIEEDVDEDEESDSNTAVISNTNDNALVSESATSNRLLDVENDDLSLASSVESSDDERVSMYAL